jgi:hypothetical protein
MELFGGCHRSPASFLVTARLTWAQHTPHAAQSETHIFSDTLFRYEREPKQRSYMVFLHSVLCPLRNLLQKTPETAA